jgi:hypothetical protein
MKQGAREGYGCEIKPATNWKFYGGFKENMKWGKGIIRMHDQVMPFEWERDKPIRR